MKEIIRFYKENLDSREKLLGPVLEQIAMHVAQTISHFFQYFTRGTRDSEPCLTRN